MHAPSHDFALPIGSASPTHTRSKTGISAHTKLAAVRQRSCFMISVPAYALFIGVGMPAFLQFFLSAHSGKGREAVRQRYYTLRYLAPHSSLMGPASPRTAPLPRLPAAAHALNKKQYPPHPTPSSPVACVGREEEEKHVSYARLVTQLSQRNTSALGSSLVRQA